MNKKKGLFLTIIFAGLLLFSSCIGFKINQELNRLQINFENKDSILKLEQDPALFETWAKWNPINLLMTKEEKGIVKKILKIEDETARHDFSKKFINWFWQRRDDNPRDEVNEFKENFYDRVVEAQTRFANNEDPLYKRKCKHGRGWETDMGIIYIILGEPFDREKHYTSDLLSFFGYQQNSMLFPQEIEVWYYNVPEEYNGSLFQEGAAWILFEKDFSWEFAEKTFNLFFRYENYYGFSVNYSMYISEVYRLMESVAEGYIYDEDLEFEDIN